ncbi:hypothetical protein BDW59DRAFT_174360 [Aspergillus cavernicola]|uniref:Uncharacterized protein n=1 Tax=Aspergillus cavernicola TaxID=176166 RepID=A0ABR4HZJ0_9EURO
MILASIYDAQPKRVILRVREAEFNCEDPDEPVRSYLQNNGRSVHELEEDRHFIHIQRFNPDIPQIDPKIHIVIYLEKYAFSGILDSDFPHELYRISCVDDKMTVGVFKDGPWYRTFLPKLRVFIDDLYPWGC